MRKEITFICPALNEEKLLASTINEFIETVRDLFDKYEILLFNDGSTDKTLEIMHNLSQQHSTIRVFSNNVNKNIGYCFKEGIKKASYCYVQLICADSIFDRESYLKIAENLNHKDIIIPYISNIKLGRSLFRSMLSKIYRFLMNFLFNLRLRYHNGLAVFRTDDLKKIIIRSDGFFFQLECLVRLIRMEKSYSEIECYSIFRRDKEDKSRSLTLKNIRDLMKSMSSLLFLKWFTRDKKKRIDKEVFFDKSFRRYTGQMRKTCLSNVLSYKDKK